MKFTAALFFVSAKPVIKVVIMCAAGAIAARRKWLPPEGRKVVSTLVFSVFVPALVLDTLAQVRHPHDFAC